MTKYYDFKEKINEKDLEEIIKIFENDGVIIFPTETVYGMGCNALSIKATKKIYEVKNRPTNKNVNIMVSSINKINEYAYVNELEEKLIHKYMPGAFTIILHKKDNLNNPAFANDTIGIRIPNHKIMLEILNRLSFPIVATSANISGDSSVYSFEDIKRIFDGKVDAIIDGGLCTNVASTIVKVENNEINILRQGTLKIER